MKKTYSITMVIALLLITTGCKKYLDINSNPAVPQVVKAELLLPPIEYQMSNGTAQDYQQIWKVTQNMGGTSTDDASTTWEKHGYVIGSDVGGVIWRMTYVDLGLNLENMIKDAVTNQKYEYAGIGYAIKAWAYQMCTDLHGPIILDEAFTVGQLSFHYQDQPDVYAKVRVWGDLAIKYLNMTSPLNYTTTLRGASGDGIYNGDKTKWKKFVYGLYALQYGHLVSKAAYKTQYADSVIKYTNMSFASEAEDAAVLFTAATTADVNPLGPTRGLMATNSSGYYYGRATTTILNYLTGGVRGIPTTGATSSVDPRLSRMLNSGTTTTPAALAYTAIQPTQGSATATVPSVWGYIPANAVNYTGKYLFTDNAPYPLMSYCQLQFAKAEALFIKGITADAYTAYIAGIRAHMDFINQYGRTKATDLAISAAEVNNYLASTEVAKSGTDLTLADIMGQKYIAQWGWAGLETWCDLRKYHYDPNVFKTYYQIPSIKFAYRFRPRYNSEYVWNIPELTKWGALAPDYNTKETWFSQQ